MRFFRKDRVSSLIQEELGTIIFREVEPPHGVLITITSVDVAKDLEVAHVNVSIMPSEYGESMMKMLKAAQKHLQFLLLRKINIRPMPEIFFRLDTGPENAARVEKALLKDQANS